VGRLLIVNRTFARARELAEAVHGEAVPWEWRGPALGASSAAVLASRVAAPLVTAASLMALTRGRREPFVLADLGVPRNAEPPAPVPAGLRLLDVDTLARTRDEREERREGAVAAALTIVEEELSRWVEFARQPRMAENGPGSPRRAADPIRCRKTRP
jgi:glutamyl-tRNA reductase